MTTTGTNEIALRLGVQWQTVCKWAVQGKIQGEKINGQWQFDMDEAERFIMGYLSTNNYIKHMKYAPRTTRFWAKVDKSGDCWNWTGGKTRKGYGSFCGKRTHRVSYELVYGPIPSDMMVCHKCDNPACVRPDHLFLGTNKDNMYDMAVKGRSNKKPTMIGDNHVNAKLSSESVLQIRKRCSEGFSQRELAAEYGVSRSLIGQIMRGEIWMHL